MKSTKPLRTYSIVFVCFAALGIASCGSVEPSPTAPSPVAPGPSPGPAPAPGPSPSPAPAPNSGPGKLEVTIDPNPVPWSGTPIEGGCAGVANTWFYTQVLENTGGNPIVVSDRTDYFNNREVSKRTGLGINLAPGAKTSITTRWCSSSSGNQTAQTNWGATDATTHSSLTVFGPVVTLRAK